jgi:AcrR family transcriptional regulator
VPGKSRPAPRKLPRQARSRALYDAILEAAAELLEKQGPQFTLAEVATRAGVGSGSFYQYFPDRAALIGALIDRQLAADRAALEAFRQTPDASLATLAARVVSGILELYGARPRSMTSMVALLHELGRQADVLSLSEEFCEVLAAHLQRARPGAAQIVCQDAARTAVHGLLGIVRQAAQEAPQRVGNDPAFRARLLAVARAALTLD